MNHAITLGGLLLGLGIIGGVGLAAFGALIVFAAGMSDAGDDGTATQGCVVIVVGLVILVGCLIGLFA